MLASTRLRYLIQPILVRWSNLYLGIPPRIKISRAIKDTNFRATMIELSDIVLKDPIVREYKLAKVKYTKSKVYCSL